MLKQPVCIYVDNSNIYIGGQTAAHGKGENKHLFRIDFRNFLLLITKGTLEFQELVWAGSGSVETETLFAGFREKGIDLQIIPRSENGENETVDQAIQLAMHRHTRKYKKAPGTVVLCTGDGRGFHDEKGFLYDVKEFTEEGWKLVLYSWECVCHSALKKFAQEHGEYHQLEKYYHAITFIQGGRQAAEIKIEDDSN
jgi:hypothetical protein